MVTQENLRPLDFSDRSRSGGTERFQALTFLRGQLQRRQFAFPSRGWEPPTPSVFCKGVSETQY